MTESLNLQYTKGAPNMGIEPDDAIVTGTVKTMSNRPGLGLAVTYEKNNRAKRKQIRLRQHQKSPSGTPVLPLLPPAPLFPLPRF